MSIQNNCTFIGRLTKDPEISTVNTAKGAMTRAKFTLAVDKAFSKGQQKESDFINFTAFGQRAEFVSRYFTKGKPMIVSASFETYKYEKDGQMVYGYNFNVNDVTFAPHDPTRGQEGGGNGGYQQPKQQGASNRSAAPKVDFNPSAFQSEFMVSDEEFPF